MALLLTIAVAPNVGSGDIVFTESCRARSLPRRLREICRNVQGRTKTLSFSCAALLSMAFLTRVSRCLNYILYLDCLRTVARRRKV